MSVPTRRFARLATTLLVTLGGAALAYVLVVHVGGALLRAAVAALFMAPRAIVWLVLALQEGADGWAIAGRIASSVGDAISTSELASWLIGLELVGAIALYGLQRVLRNETRQRR